MSINRYFCLICVFLFVFPFVKLQTIVQQCGVAHNIDIHEVQSTYLIINEI